ncbi:MAG: hypothetical protein Q9162_006428 [Coniocarpon cinnabarinum]
MASKDSFDYIIVGGGQAGCVVASRLNRALPQCTVALLEAGPDAHKNELVLSPLGCPKLHNTELEWNYMTAPQSSLDDRKIYQCSGKLLSGSSGVNYGAWVRGHATDFDEWGRMVGDERWSYKGQLPYFKKTETHHRSHEDTANPEEHGFEGPIHTTAALLYPMGEIVRDMFLENGVRHIADANSGQPLGLARWTNNWHNYTRQPAGQAYGLSSVHVLTSSLVQAITVVKDGTKTVAKGVNLADGQQLYAKREVIVCAGALRTPQILMLSGIGDSTELMQLGIDPVAHLPQVGRNLHDHGAIMLYWKLRYPEKNLAIGSSGFPPLKVGPSEWIFTGTAPREALEKAAAKDGTSSQALPQLDIPRAHFEITIGYGATAVPPGMHVPVDGSSITTGQSCFQPTSRGVVSLSCKDPAADPIIDPRYFSTEWDRCIAREAMRFSMRMMKTPTGQQEVKEQYQAEGMPISLQSSDEELNRRLRAHAMSWYHPGGTAAMGSVVDTDLRVKGVSNLRVVDASVIPKPIGTHYQGQSPS